MVDDRAAALKLAHSIITDKRNENRYLMTTIRGKDGKEKANYWDAVQVIEDLYEEARQAKEEAHHEPDAD